MGALVAVGVVKMRAPKVVAATSFTILSVVLVTLAASGPAVGDGFYASKPPSRDGIGKVYMGREISHVMGHLGAGWLERPEREREERTDLLVERLPVEPDFVVADIGAGTGYFSFPVAERLKEGRVLAVDIQPEMLAVIEQQKQHREVDNVHPILGDEMVWGPVKY